MNLYLKIILYYLFGAIPLLGLETNLINNSPFIPDGFNAKPVKRIIKKKPIIKNNQRIKRDLEFRGYYSLNGKFYFNLFNKKERKGEWLSLDSANGPYEVVKFNEGKSSLSIKVDGVIEELTLRKPTDKPMAIKTVRKSSPQVIQKNRRQVRNTNSRTNQRRRVVPRRPVIVPRRTNKNKPQASNNNAKQKNIPNKQPEIFNQLGIGLGNSNDPNNPLNNKNIPIPRRPVSQRR